MARSFNGTSDKIVCANNTNVNFPRTQAFSASCWVWFNSGAIGVDTYLVNTLDVSPNFPGWAIKKETTDKFSFYLVSVFGSNSIQTNSGAFVATSGAWHNIVWTYDGSSAAAGVTFYFDGVSKALSPNIDGLNASTSSTEPLNLGSLNSATTSFLNGKLADVAVWNTALSSGNATSLFNGVRPVNVNSANLQFWAPLDGFASPETDLSASGNNGTLTGTSGVLGPPQLWRISA